MPKLEEISVEAPEGTPAEAENAEPDDDDV